MLRILRMAPLATLMFALTPAAVNAQVTADDYARAEQFLGWNARTLVHGDEMNPQWLSESRFWYRSHGPEGYRFMMVNAAAPSLEPAFDHDRVAAGLSVAADTSYVGHKLPFDTFRFLDAATIVFQTADSVQWRCSITSYTCSGPVPEAAPDRNERVSPDGAWVAFMRDENLWVRSLDTGDERQLSRDGAEHHGYAVAAEGCCSVVTQRRSETEPAPVLLWSPDSRRIATHRLDERNVEAMHLLETHTGRPRVHEYRVALPGDSVIPTYEIHVFDVVGSNSAQADVGVMEAVNTACCQLASDTIWKDVKWGATSDEVFFTRGVRSFDTLQLYVADATTGASRMILEETSKTYVEANGSSGGLPNWQPANGNSEIVWWSERDGWGHLYLFDAETGVLKNRITEGPWMVLDLLHVDDAGRWVYFTGVGRESGRDVYFRHLYRASLDGGRVQLLTPEDADHQIWVAPGGAYFVDQFGTPDAPSVTVLRGADGRRLLDLETADYSKLLAAGWQYPTHFTARARDGVTPVHGYLYFPSDFDENASYPVIDYIYPGPQVGAIRSRQASLSESGNPQALAELGFVVFKVDALGTPMRNKAFHDAYYGNMRDNGLPDHIAALRQLAQIYPQLDLDRVGIFGHSGGGFGSTDAILSYPDFFKVAVSSAGNHDNRSYDYTWGEKYHGLLTANADGSDSFDAQANQNMAERLEGKLLLMYGTLDDNVHPNATLLVIDELIRRNKDFDLLVMPNRNHGFSNEPYVVRRTWDYFVEHLMGSTPPRQYHIIRPEG